MDILSPVHIILLLIIALLVFGPKRLPEIGAGLGKSIREFKASMDRVGSQDVNSSPAAPDQEYATTAVATEEKSPPQ
jgi:sec-independent protein translocase protein TatA